MAWSAALSAESSTPETAGLEREPSADLQPEIYARFTTLWISPVSSTVDGIGSSLLFGGEVGWYRPWFQIGLLTQYGGSGSCEFCFPLGHEQLRPLGATAAVGPIDSRAWGGALRVSYRNFEGET